MWLKYQLQLGEGQNDWIQNDWVQNFQVYYFGSKNQSVTYHNKNIDFIYVLSSPNEPFKKIKITCYRWFWTLLIQGENQGCSSTGWEGCDWQSLLLLQQKQQHPNARPPFKKMTRIFSILWNVCINHVPVALTVSWTITRLMISSNTILDLNTLCSSGCLLSRSARALKSYAKLIAATQAACHESRGMRINFIGCRKSLLII